MTKLKIFYGEGGGQGEVVLLAQFCQHFAFVRLRSGCVIIFVYLNVRPSFLRIVSEAACEAGGAATAEGGE